MNSRLIRIAKELLMNLIDTPSFSGEEENTALLIEAYFSAEKIAYNRQDNNVWSRNKFLILQNLLFFSILITTQ